MPPEFTLSLAGKAINYGYDSLDPAHSQFSLPVSLLEWARYASPRPDHDSAYKDDKLHHGLFYLLSVYGENCKSSRAPGE